MFLMMACPWHVNCFLPALIQWDKQMCTVVPPSIRQFGSIHLRLQRMQDNDSSTQVILAVTVAAAAAAVMLLLLLSLLDSAAAASVAFQWINAWTICCWDPLLLLLHWLYYCQLVRVLRLLLLPPCCYRRTYLARDAEVQRAN